jgi:predicted DNA-binding protein
MPDDKKQDRLKITVEVTEDLRRKAKIKAAKTGKPMAEVLREALEAWVADGDPLDEVEK